MLELAGQNDMCERSDRVVEVNNQLADGAVLEEHVDSEAGPVHDGWKRVCFVFFVS